MHKIIREYQETYFSNKTNCEHHKSADIRKKNNDYVAKLPFFVI